MVHKATLQKLLILDEGVVKKKEMEGIVMLGGSLAYWHACGAATPAQGLFLVVDFNDRRARKTIE